MQYWFGLTIINSAIEPDHLDHWSKAAIEQLHQLELAPATRQTLNSHLRELAFLIEEQQSIDKQIKAQAITCGQQNRIERLKTADGVGHVVASTFAAELFHPERFNRPEQVAAYLGLAPMVRESGGKHDRGRLRPVGQKRLRSLLIEAAWIWRAKDEQAKAFYDRLLSRSSIPQKAIAALARKLAIKLWRLSLDPATA
uniref:Transposase n=1 Tax=Magnetococcus massalia (strain MO-1) TaxID=451514 RepID=A0A1S7LEM3_MAGMO